jgi:hypothetical protein
MRKVLLALLVCFSVTAAASVCLAQEVHTVREDCGCGLGGYTIGDKTGMVWKLVGTFLNGISGNQTFAMSSGTLGCGQPQSLAMNEQINVFVADNMDALAVDIAQGQGESLNALAEIARIPDKKRPGLNARLQENFEAIYTSSDVTHESVVSEITRIIQTI